MSSVILPLAEGESRPARSAAAGGQFGDFSCKADFLQFDVSKALRTEFEEIFARIYDLKK